MVGTMVERKLQLGRVIGVILLALVGSSPAADGSGEPGSSEQQPSSASAPAAYLSKLRPFLAEYCFECHGKEKHRGEVDFEVLPADGGFASHRELWEKARAALVSREMPPDKKRQPAEGARLEVIEGIAAALEWVDASTPPNPGAVTIRRLNRNEYRNTIRDLFGIEYDTQASFPTDESGYGFDNIGDVLSLPPMLLEKYLAAAEEISSQVIMTEDPALKRIQKIKADRFSTQGDAISLVEDGTWGFYREGQITAEHEFTQPGEYRLRLSGYGDQAGSELPRMGVGLDGKEIHVQPVRATSGQSETFDVTIQVTEAGRHKLSVSYLNNFNSDGDRNVYLSAFEVVGPLGLPPEQYPEPHRRVLPRKPAKGEELAYAGEVLKAVARRAYRRPVSEAEVARLVRFVEMALQDKASFEEGIRLALQAVLVSPHFLYRWELDPEPLGPGESRDLNPHEVASRLSYFLWSSMPDDELLNLADQGVLRDPKVLEVQIQRMLRDPKARALVRYFGGQWLQIRNLEGVEPDPSVFPGWSDALRDDMRQESDLFLWSIIQEDRSIRDLLDARYTFVNERLAKFYGIPGVEGEEFRRVDLPTESVRGGILTMGSVLTVTSFPTRTAPVLRGKWILEQILGTPPPPPPPNVPLLDTGEEAVRSATLRQRLELHRSKPDCMVCHQKMDPLGFALENFDAIGAWREKDGPNPIDNAAELPDGRKVNGASGLKEVLGDNPDFPRAFASKLLTYALGRGLEAYDRRAIRNITEDLAKNDFKFSRLVLNIAASEPFLKRQPRPGSHEQHASIHP